MKVSFEGFNEKVLSFYNSSTAPVEVASVVKMGDSGTAAKCSAGDALCGYCISASDDFAAVQVGGFVTLPYTGTTAPTVGYTIMVADGTEGVKLATTGKDYLVLEVDTVAKTVGFIL